MDIKTFYLIDYENVHGDGLSGCKNLGKTDYIVIFFTQNAKKIDLSDISNHGAAELEIIEVPVGKQSADMHISSYLGYLAGKNGKNCSVVIVSNDTGYDNVIKFWTQKTGIMASRTKQIKKKSEPVPRVSKKQTSTTPKTSSKVNGDMKIKLKQEVMQAVRSAGIDASVANTVAQISTGLYGDESMLSEVRNALRNRYANYLDVYAAAKPVLTRYAGNVQSKSSAVAVSTQNKTAVNNEIQKTLSKAGFSNEIITYVASTAVKYMGTKNGKQQTYRSIISRYGQNKGLTIYSHIKKII